MSVYGLLAKHVSISGLHAHADAGHNDEELPNVLPQVPQHQSSGSDSGAHGYDTSSSGPPTPGTIRYKCGCGKCTIHDYLKNVTCPNPIREFPHLEIEGDSYEVCRLEQTLSKQTQDIGIEFTGLLMNTFDMLKSRNIQFRDVQQHVKRLISPAAYGQQFQINSNICGITVAKATDYMQLEDALLDGYCSWFNFGIITEIRRRFLRPDPENDKPLVTYKEKFSSYCNRRCFESPKTFHPLPLSGSKSLVFKVEKNFRKFTLNQVQHITETVAAIIDCPQYAVYVTSVQEGCVEVVGWMLSSMTVTSLTQNQINQLKRQCILSLNLESIQLIPVSHI